MSALSCQAVVIISSRARREQGQLWLISVQPDSNGRAGKGGASRVLGRRIRRCSWPRPGRVACVAGAGQVLGACDGWAGVLDLGPRVVSTRPRLGRRAAVVVEERTGR